MVGNIVSYAMQFLTPDVIGRIANALGLDRNEIQTAVGAAIPALLAGLSGVAAQAGGAQKLVDAARQQSGVLGNLAGMFTARDQTSPAEHGTQTLTSLLGSRDESALATALGKFSGLGQGASSSLLGMLAPVVLGSVAQQGARDLSANGLTALLASQKDNIAAAMPAGLGSLLSGTGLLDSLGGSVRTAAAAASQTGRGATSAAYTVRDAGRRAGAASPSFNWLYSALPLVAIAALAGYLFLNRTEQVAQRPAETVAQGSANVAPSLEVAGLDVGKHVTESISTLRSTLNGITDTATAQAALPKLQEAVGRLDLVRDRVGQLSLENRKLLSGLVSPSMPTLNQLIDKTLAIPGVDTILKPTLDSLKTKLATLTA